MTPEEYYKQEFAENYNVIKNLRVKPIINFNTMILFAELYHKYITNLKK